MSISFWINPKIIYDSLTLVSKKLHLPFWQSFPWFCVGFSNFTIVFFAALHEYIFMKGPKTKQSAKKRLKFAKTNTKIKGNIRLNDKCTFLVAIIIETFFQSWITYICIWAMSNTRNNIFARKCKDKRQLIERKSLKIFSNIVF